MIEVICNDRLGKKIRVKCNPDDTVGDLKKLLAAQATRRRPPPSGLTSPERAAHLPVEHPPSTSHPGPADGHAAREAAHPKVVHGVQGPHQLGRLRDPRRHGPRALLQLGAGRFRIRGGPSSVGAARHRFEQRGLPLSCAAPRPPREQRPRCFSARLGRAVASGVRDPRSRRAFCFTFIASSRGSLVVTGTF